MGTGNHPVSAAGLVTEKGRLGSRIPDSVEGLLWAALQVPKIPNGLVPLLSNTEYPAGTGALLAEAP